ncbi:MAG: HD domain-containing protein [Bacteroidales bacterium]|jgi:GTP pyrophosphokinase|nr:HD domain-containing protein [Bacteroidales bacterium]
MYIIDEKKQKEERKEILAKYRKLIHLATKSSNVEKKVIRKAFTIAVNAHDGVRRKGGEPYIYHPMEVARIAAEDLGLGYVSIVCALLHDVVEDTEYSIDDIKQIFGEKIAYIVDGLTKADSLYNEDTKSLQADTFEKIFTFMSADMRVVLIKLCDRLHNLRTIDSVPDVSRLKTISETQALYIPLAERLGLYQMKSELEDLVTKYNEPEQYNKIITRLADTAEDRNALLKAFIDPLKEEIEKENYKATYSSRVKSVTSILRKMQKKNVLFEDVYDKFAIRIVLDVNGTLREEHTACRNVKDIVTKLYEPISERDRDWLANPKDNGYEALHTTVMFKEGTYRGTKVEVQIRTKRMDEIDEKGLAAHYKYKYINEGEVNKNIDQWLTRIREVLETKSVTTPIDFIKDLETNIKVSNITVFTPKAKRIILPMGATVLDFAFAIHTDLGLKCMGAKINYKVYSIDHPLSQSDQLEIITSSITKPTNQWLSIVKTSKARRAIREYLEAHNEEFSETKTSIRETITNAIDTILLDKDLKDLHYIIANCCNPVKGDDIVGLHNGNEIIIHRTNCPTAQREMAVYGNRIIKAKWQNNENVSFLAGIQISGLDRAGLLQEITGVISNSGNINIREVSMKAADGTFEGRLKVYITNTTALESLIHDIQTIEGITSVSRL